MSTESIIEWMDGWCRGCGRPLVWVREIEHDFSMLLSERVYHPAEIWEPKISDCPVLLMIAGTWSQHDGPSYSLDVDTKYFSSDPVIKSYLPVTGTE